MRKLLFGAAAAVCLGAAGPAMANGSMKDTYVPEPVPIWSGCYLGGAVGGAWMDDNDFGDLKESKRDSEPYHYESKPDAKEHFKKKGEPYWRTVDTFDFDNNSDDSSVVAAALFGCNWERGNFVYGVEGDIGGGSEFDYLASLRGRLGFAWDSALVYLTGGVAFAGFDRNFGVSYEHDSDDKYDFSGTRRFGSGDDETGYVIGGGFEKYLGRNVSFGVEGLYYYFDDDDSTHKFVDGVDGYDGCNSSCNGHYHAYKFDRDVDNDIFVVRARLTYYLRDMPEPLK